MIREEKKLSDSRSKEAAQVGVSIWTWMTCSSSSSVAEAAEAMVVDSTSNMVDMVEIHLDIISNKSLSRHHSSSRAQMSSS